jgi:hypothetical protein
VFFFVCGLFYLVLPSETSVLTTPTSHNIPEDGIPHSHYCQSLKSYIDVYAFVAGEHTTSRVCTIDGFCIDFKGGRSSEEEGEDNNESGQRKVLSECACLFQNSYKPGWTEFFTHLLDFTFLV